MDREECHDEDGDDGERVQRFLIQRLACPARRAPPSRAACRTARPSRTRRRSTARMHRARHCWRACCRSRDGVRPCRCDATGLMQLANMVLGETQVRIGSNEVHSSAYPATSCSSRVLKDLTEIARESRSSTSASDSFEPSMRVEEPTLSMVATLRSAPRRSGERVPRASPPPFELIDLGDQLHEVGAEGKLGLLHGRSDSLFRFHTR